MLRRSHKKSRTGCSQCKLRHVKCDERRPICRLCAISERECSFASEPPRADSTSSSSPHEQLVSASSGNSPSQLEVTFPDASLLATLSQVAAEPVNSGINSLPDPAISEAVNLNHMDLLIHLIFTEEMFNLAIRVGTYSSRITLALKAGLESPYLLHELLAFSARHLAFVRPERSSFYLHQAVALQTRAVSLFNKSWSKVDESNCVAILLFSAVLGHHLLADTLAKRDPYGLEAFMAYYIQCAEMHRGIHAVAMASWPLLMESKLEPILSLSSGFTSRMPKGDHCQQIRELIDTTTRLDEEDKEACRLALKLLQVGFDVALAEAEEESIRHQMIFSWMVTVPPKFTDLLNARQPEALAVLAYYALLLHYGRNMWQVKDSGIYILRIIEEHLGSDWDPWLKYPGEKIAEDIE